MKGRLFWKTCLGFWITYMAISQAVPLMFSSLGYGPRLDDEVAMQLRPSVVKLCAEAISSDGPAACRSRVLSLFPDEYSHLSIEPATASPAPRAGGGDASPVAQSTAPDGRQYRIGYRVALRPRPTLFLGVPVEVLLLGTVGGCVFSLILAWYLIDPVQRLQRGFDELARGHLDIRVGKFFGRRSDEIVDLARDFDRMAERLQDLVSARDRLLHDVSHEFRSPLGRVRLAVALARKDAARIPASLDRIELEAQQLDKMVSEILTLARVESEYCAEEYFDLKGVVQSVVSDAEFESKARGVTILTDLPPDDSALPSIRGSSALVRRAIDNVMRNAVKFSSANQTIKAALELGGPPNVYRLQIDDDGPGVPNATLEHLFDPFVKAHNQTDGFGLGLSIARRALNAHGGEITAWNRPQGGFSVAITLPANGPVEA